MRDIARSGGKKRLGNEPRLGKASALGTSHHSTTGDGVNREDTFLALFESHDGALRRIVGAYAGSEGKEEDLYQEIVMQAWKSPSEERLPTTNSSERPE